jgi:glycosyltransferase involved in cell wall biosynthesis
LRDQESCILGGTTTLSFIYLGRRGGGARLALELANEVRGTAGSGASFVISRNNEHAADWKALDVALLEVNTFGHWRSPGLITNYFAAAQEIISYLKRHRPVAVVNLMPHVWTPLLGRSVRYHGMPYLTVMHDAVAHPGDRSALVTPWLRSEARFADRVVTLSSFVADQLRALRIVDPAKVRTLFHPDLHFPSGNTGARRRGANPLRLLFFGRMLKYKSLSILIEAIELLREEGTSIHVGMAGAGDLGSERSRLAALGVEVINRWVEDSEIGTLFARYDALVLPYVEASQSGVATIAYGSCMPVVGMPIGGIPEQVIDGTTGVVARGTDARALADAIRRLAADPTLYEQISRRLRETAEQRSIGRFITELAAEATTLAAIANA